MTDADATALVEAQQIAGIGSWTWDPARDTAVWSPEMYRIFGRDPAAGPATSEAFFAAVHPEDRARLADGYRQVFGGGPEFELDYRIVRPDGSERVVHALGRADGARPGRYLGTVQDVTELRAVERELRASREELWRQTQLLTQVIDQAPIGKALVAPDGRWLRVNRALCEIVGYSEADLLARTFQEITHPDDLDADLEYVRRMLAGEIRSYAMEKRYLRGDGATVWVRLSVSLLREDGGAAVCFISQIEDITAQRATEEALRDGERRLAEAQAIAHVGSWELSATDPRAVWSDELCRIVGVDLGARPTLAEFLERVHPDDRHLVTRALAAANRGTQTAVDEYRIVRPGGEIRHVQARRSATYDAAGRLLRVQGTMQDITERKAAEREIRRAREHAEAITAAMSEGYLLTRAGRILAVNDAMCAMTGFPREELIGVEIPYPYWPDGEREAIEAARDELGEDGGTFEATFVRRDGTRFAAEVTARPAREADGALIGFVSTVRDVSIQKRHQAELERLATVDSLTGLANHRVFHERLAAELARAARHGRGLSLVLLDIDRFKTVNDRHGHLAGDRVLATVARRFERATREGESLARIGGEEFALLLPDTGEHGALAAAERLRGAIAQAPIPPAGRVTVSAGVAALGDGESGASLLARADRALYEAKRSGRDRAVTALDPALTNG